MILIKKYIKPEIEIVLMKNDVITTSTDIGGGSGSGGEDPWENIMGNTSTEYRPLGIFKRN